MWAIYSLDFLVFPMPNCRAAWFSKILSTTRKGQSLCTMSCAVRYVASCLWLSTISQYIITIIKSVSLKELLIQTSASPRHCEILPWKSWPKMSDVPSVVIPFQPEKQPCCTVYFHPCFFRVLNKRRNHKSLLFPTGPDSKPLGVNSLHWFRWSEINCNICWL